ncbi:MAG: hypothetical protein FJ125_06355 [Deltaproteobacteria bacterium]|nr:hypothetical protein [Deltaproteobacteria bacterium]
MLEHLRSKYPTRTLDLVLCIYGCGSTALGFVTDCQYSREVMANINKVRRVIWARTEQSGPDSQG